MIPECKIYSDGSSYIAIPHTEGRKGPRRKPFEPIIDVVDSNVQAEVDEKTIDNAVHVETEQRQTALTAEDIANMGLVEETDEYIIKLFEQNYGAETSAPSFAYNNKPKNAEPPKGRLMTRKELFEELYNANLDKRLKERKQIVLDRMLPYFKAPEAAKAYLDKGFERKRHNIISRRVRLSRKIYLHGHWNYFVTFTYSNALHDEDSFKKQLKYALWNFTKRKEWQYAGVWERAPETGRLHFHGLFDIPDGTMPGELITVSDWDSKNHCRQETVQNTYFNERFGRSDFELITSRETLGNSIAYILKYIEKTGERIVCSKGLSAYFISDINEDDILAQINDEDKPVKYLLFDDFACWDEGLYMGQVSDAVIKQMRKAN